MNAGNMVVNGITERQLITILQFKVAHEGQFSFSPQSLQPVTPPPNVTYNNAAFSWANDDQLRLVIQLLNSLLNPSQ
jgi:hypothetical protein